MFQTTNQIQIFTFYVWESSLTFGVILGKKNVRQHSSLWASQWQLESWKNSNFKGFALAKIRGNPWKLPHVWGKSIGKSMGKSIGTSKNPWVSDFPPLLTGRSWFARWTAAASRGLPAIGRRLLHRGPYLSMVNTVKKRARCRRYIHRHRYRYIDII